MRTQVALVVIVPLVLTGCASAASVSASSPGSCVLASASTGSASAGSTGIATTTQVPGPGSYPASAATSTEPEAASAIPQFAADDERAVVTTEGCQTVQFTEAYVSIAAASGDPSAQNGEYEVATVWLSNAGTPLPYGPSDFVFTDTGGHVHQSVNSAHVPGSLAMLSSGVLSSGGKAIGTVVFDVPRGGGTVVFTPHGMPTRSVSWSTET